jgi:hypothetical protein
MPSAHYPHELEAGRRLPREMEFTDLTSVNENRWHLLETSQDYIDSRVGLSLLMCLGIPVLGFNRSPHSPRLCCRPSRFLWFARTLENTHVDLKGSLTLTAAT